MTKDEIQTRLEAAEKQFLGLQDEIANLKAKLDEVQEDEIPEFPVFKNYENAFFCDSDELYERFHTEEYAQLFADKCREIAMLLHCKWYCDRNGKENWRAGSNNYIVFYDNCHKQYDIASWTYHDFGTVVFSTEKAARKACDWMDAHAKRGANDDEKAT